MGLDILEIDDSWSLCFDCGELPVDKLIAQAGFEPNGYFWEGVAKFISPEICSMVEFDSEAGMFSVFAESPATLYRLRELLEPLASDPAALDNVIQRAIAAGHDFEDFD